MSLPGHHPARVAHAPFGHTADGRAVERFTLVGGGGAEACVLTYGGVVQTLRVPDREGRLADVALGYDDLAGYERDTAFLGALVGRVANRIARGAFELDGTVYRLALNNGPNHIHGGPNGFHRAVWQARPFAKANGVGVVLTHRSPDGDEGYPGNLEVRVTYTLTADNVLRVEYHAVTDRATPVNLTQHAYFNLAGEGEGDVLGHEVTVNASLFTPVDETLIPTGEIAPVAGTPLDFRAPAPLGERIDADFEQLRFAGGYDQNYVIDRGAQPMALAARVYEPGSGRLLEVRTTEPGVQLYSGNFLQGEPGKHDHRYERRTGLCLETQHFPDSPNQPGFPSVILRPGEEFSSCTEFAFSARP